ncbi:hypothetical protein HPB48_007278 [Haemaphysalis longicornis]|uniref:Uncharacterized protein n=1 Tax=Haemaphysalis longicornis TaxID=44386 RepID=A0A9J6FBW7_HAELO|nr:hypothetical protein HPB48_007278 [Haemaphysalis longicornis]
MCNMPVCRSPSRYLPKCPKTNRCHSAYKQFQGKIITASPPEHFAKATTRGKDMHGTPTKAHTPATRDPVQERGTSCYIFAMQPVITAFIFRGRAATLPLQVCLPSPFQSEALFPVPESGSLHVKALFLIQEQDPLQIQAPCPIQDQGLFEIGTPLPVPPPFPIREPFPTRLQVCLQIWPWTQLQQPV